jgi:hypothetical protein
MIKMVYGRHPVESIVLPRRFRDTVPSGNYDLVIVSLVHQTPDVVHCIAENVKKYVKGRFLWVAHCNTHEFLDETTLPDFAWIVRDTIVTRAYSVSLTHAVSRCLDFASNVTYTNALIMTSGSSFFRDYTVPTYPRIGLFSHEILLENKRLLHNEPISISELGKCSEYLATQGSGAWQYENFDKDTEFHTLFRTRGFKWILGSPFSGLMFPCAVAEQLRDDLFALETNPDTNIPCYATEEIVFATYAYNYAIQHGLHIGLSESIIHWGERYNVTIDQIEKYRMCAIALPGLGHIVCRLPEYVDKVRTYLLR